MQNQKKSLPIFATPCIKPYLTLEKVFSENHERIQSWFKEEWKKSPPPLYGSVDLRNAGFKIAPIDMNLFPAGFNNLNKDFLAHGIAAARNTIHAINPSIKNILLIPENHTRNLKYWENIKTLKTIIVSAGFNLRIGTLAPENFTDPIIIAGDEKILVETISRKDDVLSIADFIPDFIILNNDLSSGIPSILENVKQPIAPAAKLGWSERLKSEHFQYYAKVTQEFAEFLGIDAWLIAPFFKHCGKINFMQDDKTDCLYENAEQLFAEIKKKYAEYNITHPPFIVVKADAGTYGMAVMMIKDLNDLKHLNRKQRTKMSKTKGGQPVTSVIIQEGIYTFEKFDQAVAEPVVYLWGEHVIGGFYRIHHERGIDENLNSPGMQFEPIAFMDKCHEPIQDCQNTHNRFFLYGIIAELSMLAAAREMKEIGA